MPVLDSLWRMTGNNITINRLHLEPSNFNLLIGGKSSTELEIINFKNRLSQNNYFESIILPLSQIIREGDEVGFQMSVKIREKS